MVLLSFLADSPAYGYDLKRRYDSAYPLGRPIASGQVYAALSRLQKDNLVEQVESGAALGPERVTYAITDVGEKELAVWLDQPVPAPSGAPDELVRKVIALQQRGKSIRGWLVQQRATYLDQMRQLLRQQRSHQDPAARIVIDHQVARLDADLRWLDSTEELLSRENS